MIIVADDLTGANDSAIQFARCGFSTLVLTTLNGSFNRPLVENYEILSVNTDSRWMCEQQAYATVRSTLENSLFVNKSTETAYYKKIDSMLRGNTAVELDAMMDALGKRLAIVAPSFPENNRTVEHGMLKAGNQTIDALKLLAEGMHRSVENIPLDVVRQGSRSIGKFILNHRALGTEVFVADAIENIDLREVFESVASIDESVLLSGSAGFAKQVAMNSPIRKPAAHNSFVAVSQHAGPSIVLAGTRNFETAHQLRLASKSFGVPIVELPVQMILEGEFEQAEQEVYRQVRHSSDHVSDLIIIAVSSMFANRTFKLKDEEHEIVQADLIARSLGAIAKRLLHECGPCNFITTGGDTSMKVCAALEAIGIEPIEEICPGIPMGYLVGGCASGNIFVTKSG